MIDLAEYLRDQWGLASAGFDAGAARRQGVGLTLGLIDSAIALGVDDLVGADITVRGFARHPTTSRSLRDHGTCSASLLVAQGHRHLLGLVPRARLLVATVSEDDGVAQPLCVAAAFAWLASAGASAIVVPMGSRDGDPEVERAAARAIAHGVQVWAADGGDPERPWFPARVPGVHAISPSSRGDVPALGADGLVSPRGGSSIACVVAAGLAARGAALVDPPVEAEAATLPRAAARS
jgi:hypothetical protein